MINVVVGLIIAAMLAAAIVYIVKAKKKGVKCIGCSASDTCSHAKANASAAGTGCGCGCGCGSDCETEK